MTLTSGKGDIQILMITLYFFYLLVSKHMHFQNSKIFFWQNDNVRPSVYTFGLNVSKMPLNSGKGDIKILIPSFDFHTNQEVEKKYFSNFQISFERILMSVHLSVCLLIFANFPIENRLTFDSIKITSQNFLCLIDNFAF